MTRIVVNEYGYIIVINTGAGRGLEPDYVEWFPEEIDFSVMLEDQRDEFGNLQWKLEPDPKDPEKYLGPIKQPPYPTEEQIETLRVSKVQERIRRELGDECHEMALVWERMEVGETEAVRTFREAVAQIKIEVGGDIDAILASRTP